MFRNLRNVIDTTSQSLRKLRTGIATAAAAPVFGRIGLAAVANAARMKRIGVAIVAGTLVSNGGAPEIVTFDSGLLDTCFDRGVVSTSVVVIAERISL